MKELTFENYVVIFDFDGVTKRASKVGQFTSTFIEDLIEDEVACAVAVHVQI